MRQVKGIWSDSSHAWEGIDEILPTAQNNGWLDENDPAGEAFDTCSGHISFYLANHGLTTCARNKRKAVKKPHSTIRIGDRKREK